MVFCQVEDLSTSNITLCFEPAFTTLREAVRANKHILVHCHAGKSRSPAVVIAFLIHFYHTSLKTAYRHVEKARNGFPFSFLIQLLLYSFLRLAMNPTFKRQLSDFEFYLFGKRSLRFCVFCGEYDCACISQQQLVVHFLNQVHIQLLLSELRRLRMIRDTYKKSIQDIIYLQQTDSRQTFHYQPQKPSRVSVNHSSSSWPVSGHTSSLFWMASVQSIHPPSFLS